MNCDAEMCPVWTGQGCICKVMDLGKFSDNYAPPPAEELDPTDEDI